MSYSEDERGIWLIREDAGDWNSFPGGYVSGTYAQAQEYAEKLFGETHRRFVSHGIESEICIEKIEVTEL